MGNSGKIPAALSWLLTSLLVPTGASPRSCSSSKCDPGSEIPNQSPNLCIGPFPSSRCPVSLWIFSDLRVPSRQLNPAAPVLASSLPLSPSSLQLLLDVPGLFSSDSLPISPSHPSIPTPYLPSELSSPPEQGLVALPPGVVLQNETTMNLSDFPWFYLITPPACSQYYSLSLISCGSTWPLSGVPSFNWRAPAWVLCSRYHCGLTAPLAPISPSLPPPAPLPCPSSRWIVWINDSLGVARGDNGPQIFEGGRRRIVPGGVLGRRESWQGQGWDRERADGEGRWADDAVGLRIS